MMRILYFGNDMTRHGKTPTGINFLGDALSEYYEVVKYSDKKNQFLRLLHMFFGLIKNANTARYAIIDTYSTLGFYYAVIIGFLSKLLGIPYIPILRGGSLPERFEQSPRISGFYLKNAYKLVIPSDYLQKRVADLGYKTEFIPNLIDLSNYHFQPRSKPGPRLVWIRSLKEIYNPKMAIEVLALLRRKYPEASLCMIGPAIDHTKDECLQLAKELGLNGELKLTGMLSKQALRETSASYDIFINTTNVDNTPMSVLEAMAMGLPVVSTNVGGIPFLVKDGQEGLLCPPGNHTAMADSIEKLINDPELALNLANNALKKAQLFDKKQVINQWQAILK